MGVQMKMSLQQSSGRAKCRHQKCEQKPEYNELGKIKKGTTCALISTDGPRGWHTSYYCRDCIEKIYLDFKKVLNHNLWIFS